MRVELTPTGCVVTREQGDPVFYGHRNAAGESRLLYHVKRSLARQGWDFVKKRMCRDGHLVDDLQQYLRERIVKPGRRCLAIFNGRWAIQGADEALRRHGRVVLVVRDIGLEAD